MSSNNIDAKLSFLFKFIKNKGLIKEAYEVSRLAKEAMPHKGEIRRYLDLFRHYVRSADKILVEEYHIDQKRVRAKDIANYYVKNPIDHESRSMNLFEFYNLEYRASRGMQPVTERVFLQTVAKAREWGGDIGFKRNLNKLDKKRSLKNLLKLIDEAKKSGGPIDPHIGEISKATGVSTAKVRGYFLAHKIDSPLGNLLMLIKRRQPHSTANTILSVIKDIFGSDDMLNMFLSSITHEEMVAFPRLSEVSSRKDFNLNSRNKVTPGVLEIKFTLSLLNNATGSQAQSQALGAERIMREVIVEELIGNSHIQSSSLIAKQGCGTVYVPGMSDDTTFNALFLSPYITASFIAMKVSDYLEKCFNLKKSPVTITKWFDSMGIWNLRKSQIKDAGPTPERCKDLQPLLNRIICTELSCMEKLSIGEAKAHWKNIYFIIKEFLKKHDITLKGCIDSNDGLKTKSCKMSIQTKYESLNKFIDHDKDRLYSAISGEIDSVSGNQGLGIEASNLIREYFKENSACIRDFDDNSTNDNLPPEDSELLDANKVGQIGVDYDS